MPVSLSYLDTLGTNSLFGRFSRLAYEVTKILMQEINMAVLHTLNEQIFANTNNAAHGTEIPANARLLFSNGQVGQRLDGSIPDSPAEQVEVIFERLRIILEAADMSFDEVIKFSVFVTNARILEDFQRIRLEKMGDNAPPATLLVVGPFPRPGIEIEIEAVAAKVD